MDGLGIAEDCGEGAGFQRLFHEPEQGCWLFQRDGDQAAAGEAQALKPMAVEPAMLALHPGETAPQQGPPFRRIGEAAQRQGESEAHGGGHVAMGGGGDVVEAAAGEALRREMAVDRRQAGQPGPAAAAPAIKARFAVFDPGDVLAQGRQQGGNIFPLPECGVAKTLRPLKPRRFHTHTIMCRMFAFCSIRPDDRSQLGKLC